MVWANLTAALAAADMSVGNLVEVTTFLRNRAHAAVNTAVRGEVLRGHRPALTVIVARIWDPGVAGRDRSRRRGLSDRRSIGLRTRSSCSVQLAAVPHSAARTAPLTAEGHTSGLLAAGRASRWGFGYRDALRRTGVGQPAVKSWPGTAVDVATVIVRG